MSASGYGELHRLLIYAETISFYSENQENYADFYKYVALSKKHSTDCSLTELPQEGYPSGLDRVGPSGRLLFVDAQNNLAVTTRNNLALTMHYNLAIVRRNSLALREGVQWLLHRHNAGLPML